MITTAFKKIGATYLAYQMDCYYNRLDMNICKTIYFFKSKSSIWCTIRQNSFLAFAMTVQDSAKAENRIRMKVFMENEINMLFVS